MNINSDWYLEYIEELIGEQESIIDAIINTPVSNRYSKEELHEMLNIAEETLIKMEKTKTMLEGNHA